MIGQPVTYSRNSFPIGWPSERGSYPFGHLCHGFPHYACAPRRPCRPPLHWFPLLWLIGIVSLALDQPYGTQTRGGSFMGQASADKSVIGLRAEIGCSTRRTPGGSGPKMGRWWLRAETSVGGRAGGSGGKSDCRREARGSHPLLQSIIMHSL
jgi:hypothetical protein